MTTPIAPRPVYTTPATPKSTDPWVRAQIARLAQSVSPMNTRTLTANGMMQTTDDLILVDTAAGNVSVTLLPARQWQFVRVGIKNIGGAGNHVTLVGTVDGAVNPTLADKKASWLQSDGTSIWLVASA